MESLKARSDSPGWGTPRSMSPCTPPVTPFPPQPGNPASQGLSTRARRAFVLRRWVPSEQVERPLEVLGVLAGERHVLPRPRVLEAEPDRVQPLPLQPDPLGEDRVGAVGEVADARVVQGREVHPDLVRPTGLEVDV